MGRHRAPDRHSPTATDLIAQLSEEESRPPAPVAPEVELVFGDDAPTERIGRIPLRVRMVESTDGVLSTAESTPFPVTRIMTALPPVFPVAVESAHRDS